MKRLWKRFICRLRGHVYSAPVFQANRLYFCQRCGKEMFDGTFDDLTPSDDDHWNDLMHDDWEGE